jgi:hypothetical protein
LNNILINIGIAQDKLTRMKVLSKVRFHLQP